MHRDVTHDDVVSGEPRIRVLVVDDHSVVRKGLRTFFGMLDDIEVVGEAADGLHALDLLAALAAEDALPDVVLMDLEMPRMDGISATAEIKKTFTDVEVVALTSFSEAERVHLALEVGAAGYLLKDADADEVGVAVRAAHRGEIHLDAAVVSKLTRSLRQPAETAAVLTPREREILALVAQGQSNRDIARALTISERTTRTHVSNVLGKLGLVSRTQAALWAIREGLAPGP
ncbi:response regulator transcription factor [Actinocorallia longicatena]|uniref:Response regulator transcription factor n=1 Tax=Actinocorallia longicatena TaxID=111803 RepID=A0ABP6Q5Q3_9ACTN